MDETPRYDRLRRAKRGGRRHIVASWHANARRGLNACLLFPDLSPLPNEDMHSEHDLSQRLNDAVRSTYAPREDVCPFHSQPTNRGKDVQYSRHIVCRTAREGIPIVTFADEMIAFPSDGDTSRLSLKLQLQRKYFHKTVEAMAREGDARALKNLFVYLSNRLRITEHPEWERELLKILASSLDQLQIKVPAPANRSKTLQDGKCDKAIDATLVPEQHVAHAEITPITSMMRELCCAADSHLLTINVAIEVIQAMLTSLLLKTLRAKDSQDKQQVERGKRALLEMRDQADRWKQPSASGASIATEFDHALELIRRW
ncbi:hypothetical protein [Paraburkholderia sediminicola]|uniref:hypothetical protein n=1 Tax=Paraburkholderia sediminicola TaxID=458836 RepID=UPI0038BB7ACA